MIQETFGWDGIEGPVAEVWYGAHPSAPSVAVDPETQDVCREFYLANDGLQSWSQSYQELGKLIRANPHAMLGKVVLENFGPRLPYLLKLLAAAQPLSLQVHPKAHMARAGFQRESNLGIPLADAKRNYKDSSHKPEMLVALTDFEGLCGFRRPQKVLQLLDGLDGETVRQMYLAVETQPNARGIEHALKAALTLRGKDCEVEVSRTMASIYARIEREASDPSGVSRSYRTALELFQRYPNDPGALVSLMLNRVSLAPGEAIFLPAGQMHAYLEGLGIEVMANSDNVLRAGLTTKNIDIPELISITDFSPSRVVQPVISTVKSEFQKYHGVAEEFSLYYGPIREPIMVENRGPRIVFCVSGRIKLRAADNSAVDLSDGQSVFVPDSLGPIEFDGSGSAAMACVSNI